MSFLKRKKVVSRSRDPGYINKNLNTYSYQQRKKKQDVREKGREIKEVGIEKIRSARKIWLEKFGLIILGIVTLVCAVSIIYLSNTPLVVLESGKNNPIYSGKLSDLKQAANKLLSSSILNSNKITVNTSKIKTTLANEFPMFSTVTMNLPLINNHPTITVTPATPAILAANSAGHYLINVSGQIMDRTNSANAYKDIGLPALNYQSVDYQSVGTQVLTSDEVQFIQTVIYELSIKKERPVSMNFIQGTFELDVNLPGLPYFAKFNMENNSGRQQAGSLLATQHYLSSQNITPGQYIDVRTDGRVYYQ